jgi:hypothetical protein
MKVWMCYGSRSYRQPGGRMTHQAMLLWLSQQRGAFRCAMVIDPYHLIYGLKR